MNIINEAITKRHCVNCKFMPLGKGYLCTKLNKTFDGHKIDKGYIPCKGKEFKHYLT